MMKSLIIILKVLNQIKAGTINIPQAYFTHRPCVCSRGDIMKLKPENVWKCIISKQKNEE